MVFYCRTILFALLMANSAQGTVDKKNPLLCGKLLADQRPTNTRTHFQWEGTHTVLIYDSPQDFGKAILTARAFDEGNHFRLQLLDSDQSSVINEVDLPYLLNGSSRIYPLQVDEAQAQMEESAVLLALKINNISWEAFQKQRAQITSTKTSPTRFDLDCLTISYLVVHHPQRIAVAKNGMAHNQLTLEQLKAFLFVHEIPNSSQLRNAHFAELMAGLRMMHEHGYEKEADLAAYEIYMALRKESSP